MFFQCQIPAQLQSEVDIQIPLNKDAGPLKGLFKAQVRSPTDSFKERIYCKIHPTEEMSLLAKLHSF